MKFTYSMYYTYCDSPVGRLLLAGDENGLKLINFQAGRIKRKPEDGWKRDAGRFQTAVDELNAYFSGHLKRFSVPILLQGTPFQVLVLKELQNVSYGATISYGELAGKIGRPKAARAVGAANAANPIPIIIPCHRVIGSNGKLTGFGGGLEAKQILLDLEQKYQ